MNLGHPALLPTAPFGLAQIPLASLLGVLRAVGDRLHEGFYLLDSQGRMQYANPATQRMLGVQRESQVLGRDLSAMFRRLADEVQDRRYTVLDERGESAAQLGVMVRNGARAVTPLRDSVAASAGGYPVRRPEDLDVEVDGLGCVVVRVITEADAREADALLRDLCHLIARVTRPEDMVVRISRDCVALFAHVDTLAGVKALAERLTARGRREIREEFRVGIALAGSGDTPVSLVADAQSVDYTTKPRMRGRVAAHRSGASLAL